MTRRAQSRGLLSAEKTEFGRKAFLAPHANNYLFWDRIFLGQNNKIGSLNKSVNKLHI